MSTPHTLVYSLAGSRGKMHEKHYPSRDEVISFLLAIYETEHVTSFVIVPTPKKQKEHRNEANSSR